MTDVAKPIATRNAYGEELLAMAEREERLVVLDADLTKSTMTAAFAKAYPDRFFNMGIAEADMIGVAAGLSTLGLIPFVSSFAVFATGRAYDQIRNTIAYAGLNVKIAATHAGLTVGEDGGSHQALEDIGLMRGLPGMTVIVPADGEEVRQAVRLAAAYQGPVYLRLGRSAVPSVHTEDYRLTWGKAQVLCEGDAISICASGYMVHLALQAAESLAEEGISAEVLGVPFIKPLDKATILASTAKTRRVITAEEHSCYNGLGSAVAELLAENLPCPLRRIAVQDSFGESGKPAAVMQKFGLTAEAVAQAAKQMLQ